ncbi:TPM domain-containing protein [Aquabacterium sp.]|uniref:TPM domain-containing protein n=1 Tax=Aquabacterium sp. TaxID=1872578 RepID=UPI0025C6B54E|nr:TPM domain-containing protein [Aquabacterium sp.]
MNALTGPDPAQHGGLASLPGARRLHGLSSSVLAAVMALVVALMIALVGLLWGGAARAQGLPGGVLPVPPLSGHVVDQTATLGGDEARALEAKLTQLEQRLGSQLVVLIVPTTQPEDIATYSQRVGDSWKIGRKTVGDGLLIVVAKQDRSVRIEVAKALEGAIPDLAAHQVIERVITPAFKAGDFAGGLSQAVDHLAARIQGENLPLPDASGTSARGRDDGLDLNSLIVFGLVGVPIVFGVLSSVLGRKLGAAAD